MKRPRAKRRRKKSPSTLQRFLVLVGVLCLVCCLCISCSLDVDSNEQFKNLFQWETFNKSASVLAFRLTKGKKGFVCYMGYCLNASSRWEFVGGSGTQNHLDLLLALDGNHWSVMSFPTRQTQSRDFFNPPHLRLPASVLNEIHEGQGIIETNRSREKNLYKIISDRPWSSHWRTPLASQITSEFGALRIPPSGIPYAHSGLDLRASPNTPVKACSDGQIIEAVYDPAEGNVITIDHGQGLFSKYLHLSKFTSKIGDEVKAGEIIGLSGTTGRSEAPHLHWEIRYQGRPMDPVSTMHLMEHLSYLE